MKSLLYAGVLMAVIVAQVLSAAQAQRLSVSDNKRFLVLDDASKGFPPPGRK